MKFQYLAVEGPIGVGKTAVVEHLAQRLEAHTILEEWSQNPFLKSFYDGAARAAFQVEALELAGAGDDGGPALLARGDALLRAGEPEAARAAFTAARELALRAGDNALLAEAAPRPDLVIYLQAPTEVLVRRIRQRGRPEETRLSEEYLAEVNRAYNHYFFHYSQTPLLVVNTAEVDFAKRAEDVDDLVKQIRQMGKGTQYYVPMASK